MNVPILILLFCFNNKRRGDSDFTAHSDLSVESKDPEKHI